MTYGNLRLAIFLFFVLVVANFSDSREISKRMLVADSWGPEEMSLGYHLEFKDSGEYMKHFAGPGSWQCAGKFRIESGTVYLSSGKFIPEATPRDYMDCEAKKCTLDLDNDSLYRNRKLVCKPGKGVYYMKSAAVPAGAERVIRGEKAITVGLKTAVLKTAMKIRTAPNSKAKAYFFRKLEAENDRDSLPERHEITLLARTKQKDKIGSNENYWYFADLGLEMSYCASPFKENICESTGWIFGEWLDIKQ